MILFNLTSIELKLHLSEYILLNRGMRLGDASYAEEIAGENLREILLRIERRDAVNAA